MTQDSKSDSPLGPVLLRAEKQQAGRLEDLIEGLSNLDGALSEGDCTAPPDGVTQPCPLPGEWLRVATGEAESKDMETLLAHAADCRDCSTRLRQSLKLYSEDVMPEEVAAVERLSSNSFEWQSRMAAELARTPHKPERGKQIRRCYLWAGAVLAASLTIAVGLIAWRLEMSAPERLLAQAYSSSRNFDLRIPQAGYAAETPQNHLRGGSSAPDSSALHDAQTRIAGHLKRSPQDPHWLQMDARAEILAQKFDPAIAVLDQLLAASPANFSLYLDDATAYFERGNCSGSESDRNMALDYLRRADELAPGNPVVLFNEALVMEDRGQRMNAVETWNRYLRFERDPNWREEGKRRLDALEKKLDPPVITQSVNR